MREIKFRALDENCEWIYGIPLTNVEYEEKEFPIMRNCDETGYWGIKKIHPKTLGQYTGLKDKNGVEIYEGDILTSNVQPCKMVNPIKDGYGVVRFENGMFKIGAISLVTFISKMEVIGNIYENKELLEREN